MAIVTALRSVPAKLEKASFHFLLNRFRKDINPSLPRHIQIEPTVRCNLNCAFCSRRLVIGDYARVDFPVDEFGKVLVQFPDLRSVRLQGLGEPLMHPGIEALLRKLKQRGVRTWLATNGTLLNRKTMRELVHEYVDDLAVSIDSPDRTVFSELRRGARLDDVCEGVRALVKERPAGKRGTTVGINFVVSHRNYTRARALAALAADLKVDYVSFVAVENWTVRGERGFDESSGFVREARRRNKDISREIRAASRKLLARGILPGFKRPSRRLGKCLWPFAATFITVEGYVTPCCIRMHSGHALGTLRGDTSFEQLWHSDVYRRLRQCHLSLDQGNPMCGMCPD